GPVQQGARPHAVGQDQGGGGGVGRPPQALSRRPAAAGPAGPGGADPQRPRGRRRAVVILFLVRLARVVVVLMVLRLLLRLGPSVVQGYRAGGRRRAATEMVRARVCDTFLPRSRALVAIVDGREQHFCSRECRDRARAGLTAAVT